MRAPEQLARPRWDERGRPRGAWRTWFESSDQTPMGHPRHPLGMKLALRVPPTDVVQLSGAVSPKVRLTRGVCRHP